MDLGHTPQRKKAIAGLPGVILHVGFRLVSER